MRNLVAATVTLDDIQTYFKGEHWRSSFREGVFEARSDSYLVELRPSDAPQFAVKIYAYEDESDSDEAVTDDPMKFLVEFLKTGTAGDVELQKMASVIRQVSALTPDVLANILRSWAADVETKRVSTTTLSRALRHVAVVPALQKVQVQAAGRKETEVKGVQELADKMTDKGWRVKTGESDLGLPELTVDIAGVYEAKIEVDHIPWNYSFEVHEHPETKMEGVTDDPIVQFRKFYKSDEVQTAKSGLKAGKKERVQEEAEKGTVAPPKKKPGEPHGDYESGGPA